MSTAVLMGLRTDAAERSEFIMKSGFPLPYDYITTRLSNLLVVVCAWPRSVYFKAFSIDWRVTC